MDDSKCGQATPHGTLLEQIMDSRQAKTEREWVAAREIESLRQQLTAANERIREMEAERDDFHMQYRMECDKDTKRLEEKLTAERAISDKLEKALKIAKKFCDGLTSEECPDTVAIPINAALAEVAAIRKK